METPRNISMTFALRNILLEVRLGMSNFRPGDLHLTPNIDFLMSLPFWDITPCR